MQLTTNAYARTHKNTQSNGQTFSPIIATSLALALSASFAMAAGTLDPNDKNDSDKTNNPLFGTNVIEANGHSVPGLGMLETSDKGNGGVAHSTGIVKVNSSTTNTESTGVYNPIFSTKVIGSAGSSGVSTTQMTDYILKNIKFDFSKKCAAATGTCSNNGKNDITLADTTLWGSNSGELDVLVKRDNKDSFVTIDNSAEFFKTSHDETTNTNTGNVNHGKDKNSGRTIKLNTDGKGSLIFNFSDSSDNKQQAAILRFHKNDFKPNGSSQTRTGNNDDDKLFGLIGNIVINGNNGICSGEATTGSITESTDLKPGDKNLHATFYQGSGMKGNIIAYNTSKDSQNPDNAISSTDKNPSPMVVAKL